MPPLRLCHVARRSALLLLASCACGDPPEPFDGDSDTQPPDVAAEIQAALTLISDGERFDRLAALREDLPNDDPVAVDLDALLPDLERWAHPSRFWVADAWQRTGEDGVLGGFFMFSVLPEPGGPGAWPAPLRADSPLQPIRSWLRARALIWAAVENDFLTDAFYADAEDHLAVVVEAVPDHPIVGLYLGDPIPWADAPETDANLPAWANDLHTALSAQHEIATYWASHQLPDGQLGGGWGDDVEAWRNLTAALIGFEVPELTAAWTALAEGAWARDSMADGYLSKVIDVEHGAEESGDTITWMLQLVDGGGWPERAGHLVDLATDHWWGTNDLGQRQFRSSWLGAEGPSDAPAYACDTNYHTRVLQPALLTWGRDALSIERSEAIADWLRTWVDAAARADQGKPAGILPSALHWPTGRPGGPDIAQPWWDPGCHTVDRTFRYPRAMSPMMRSLVLAAWRTGDDAFLAPVDALADLRNAWAEDPSGDDVTGSAMWSAEAAHRGLRDAMEKHALLTGTYRWPTAWARDVGGVAAARRAEDWSGVEASLASTAEALRHDMPARTTEVRFTDRIFKFHAAYLDRVDRRVHPNADPGLLYELVTGDLGDPLYLPLPAVRWHADPRDLAPLVRVATPDQLVVDLVWFGPADEAPSVSLRRAPGVGATWTLDCDGQVATGTVPDDLRVSLPLPVRVPCTLSIQED